MSFSVNLDADSARSESHAILSRRILTPEGWRSGAVLVTGERIAAIRDAEEVPTDLPVYDVGDAVLTPGVVDTHVHLNEPGRTEWEGFACGTRAAAAGGITTLVDMPLNSIPVTTTLAGLQAKQAAAQDHCWVDVGLWGGVVPGNLEQLGPMAEAGVLGFKAFMCDSGIEEFPASSEVVLRAAMRELAPLGVPLLVHAELESAGPAAVTASRDYATFLASRPAAMEVAAIAVLARLCLETGCRVHIVHLSAADALPVIAKAREVGAPLSVETCPHYLTFAAEEIPDGATEFKCIPPIREASNRERLWQALQEGVIDFVACDHSPCTPALKQRELGDFQAAWGGIASLQFSLMAVWTAAQARGIALPQVYDWLAARPAAFCRQGRRKGAIAPGLDADLVAWQPDVPVLVQADRLFHRHPTTPYLGRELRGRVDATWLRGRRIYHDGACVEHPIGRLLRP